MLRILGKCRACLRRLFSTSAMRKDREMYTRDDRPSMNIGTLGSSQHGKTAMVAAFTRVLHESHGVPVKTVADIDNGAHERSSGMSQNPTHIELWTDRFRYSLVDLPGSQPYLRNTFTHISQLDVSLLVINPEEGLNQDAVDMYRISRHFGIHTVPVISTRGETEPETIDLVNMELDELGLDEVPAILLEDPVSGDPQVTVQNFFSELESSIKIPERKEEGALYFPLEQVGNIPSRGVFCAGRLKCGRIDKLGTQLEVFYNGQTSKATVRDMEIFRKRTDKLVAGDRGGVFVKLKPEIEVKRGGVLFSGPKADFSSRWRMQLKMLPGGQPSSVKGELVLFHSTYSEGRTTLPAGEQLTEEFKEVDVQLSGGLMGAAGDPVLLRTHQNSYIVGNLVNPL